MNLENMERFFINFLHRSITLILNTRCLIVINQALKSNSTFNLATSNLANLFPKNIQFELDEIFNEDYLLEANNNFSTFNKNYFVDLVLLNCKANVLLERWELQCDYSYSFLMSQKDNLDLDIDEDCSVQQVDENMLIEGMLKNITKVLDNLPSIQNQNFKVGFKIYNKNTKSNCVNFSARKFKLIKTHSWSNKFSLNVKLEHLDEVELKKIEQELRQSEELYCSNLIAKRRRCFSEGDKVEFEVKIIQVKDIEENYFFDNDKNKLEDSFQLNFKSSNSSLNEVVDKYTTLKEKLKFESRVNYWSYLNMYFNKITFVYKN